MIKIEKLQNKHKIHIEYSIKSPVPFASIRPENDGVVINVFLKDGRRFYADDIQKITIKVRD